MASRYITKDNEVYSAGGIVYYLHPKDGAPRFLLLKRHSIRKNIERVAPKGKQEPGEKGEQTALREVGEETGIDTSLVKVLGIVGNTKLEQIRFENQMIDKIISFYLMEYRGDPNALRVADDEGYVGMYKRATYQDVLNLVSYPNMRALFQKAYDMVTKK